MIAEAATEYSYAAIGWIVVGVAACCVAANQVDDFLDRRKVKGGSPPNEQLEVTQEDLRRRVKNLEETIVEKEWFTKMETDIERLRVEANDHRENKDRIDSTHRASIYKAVEAVRTETSRHIEEIRRELSGDIKDMPSQVVTLLKNTKGLI